MDDAKREKMKARIANLIAKAESTDYSAERDAFREKAESLMFQYAIEEAELAKAEGRNLRDEVIKRRVRTSPGGSAYHDSLKALLTVICNNNRCKVAFWNTSKVAQPVDGLVFGMEQDVEFVETLFASLRLQMAREMEPKFDPSMSMEDNVLHMRHAGLKWTRIEELCGLGSWGGPKTYAKACEEQGIEQRKNQNPRTMARNFAEGFVGRVGKRMYENRKRREEQNTGSGTALVPVRNAVDEVFRAGTSKSRARSASQRGKFDAEAFRRGDAAGKRADLGQTRVRKQPEIG